MALITTTSELKDFLPTLVSSFDITDIEPMIGAVESEWISRLISKDLYDTIHANYLASTLTPEEEALLPLIQKPLANMALLYSIPLLALTISNGGITVPNSDKYAPASQAKIEDLKDAVRQMAHNGFEELLRFLDENKIDYPDWATSDEYDELKECFITSAREFSKSFNIRDSHWLYWNFRSIMLRIQEDKIKPITGQDQFDEIKAEINSGAVSAENEELLKFIRSAIAQLTIMEAIIEMGLRIDDKGITIFTSGTSSSQTITLRNVAPVSSIKMLQDKCEMLGNQKLKELSEYLHANAATYPLFESSSAYTPTSDFVFTNDDTTQKIFFT